MSFQTGTRIGPYEIIAPLGAGGMGEVYRARDSKLNREVALKVLPEAFATDAGRLARFTREAQTLAALNHPNIAAIYGIEESTVLEDEGAERPVQALVMELVEGEDLSERIARGALPVEDALEIAHQIIDALEAAHQIGIIHRDLKPANIKVREDGTVKVLDFGLAKATQPSFGEASEGKTEAANSPTLTALATQMGMILGTAGYMSPEQARGRPVDKRTDVWAFGCVLYEMLTGRKAFEGEDATEIISAVVKTEPDWTALPASVPARVRTVVTQCLVKDPKARIPDLSVVRYLLDGTIAAESADDGLPAVSLRSVRAWQAVAAVLLLATVAAVGAWYRAGTDGPAEPADVMQFSLASEGEVGLSLEPARVDHVAISPDGRVLVYQGGEKSGSASGETFLVTRRLEENESAVLRGSEGGVEPFFSPDSDFIGFVDRGFRVLKKVPVSGGTAKEIARTDGQIAGATWTEDGQIIFGVGGRRSTRGLFSVSAEGGSPSRLSTLDEDSNLVRPSAIPGTRAVLFVSAPGAPGLSGQLMVLDRDTGTAKSLVLEGVNPVYLPSGHLLYANWEGAVLAVPFDVDRLEVSGTPVVVLERVQSNASGSADFSVSSQGRLAYIAGTEDETNESTLVWITPDGVEEPIAAPSRVYKSVRVSPGGNQLFLDIDDPVLARSSQLPISTFRSSSRIWVWDLNRPSLLRPWIETTTVNQFPIWTPDGTHVIYSDGPNLFSRLVDGTGDAVQLTRITEGLRIPDAVSAGGRVIFSYRLAPGNRPNLRLVSLDGDRGETPLLQTGSGDQHAALSPDGRWVAYEQGGTAEPVVYVRPFPEVSGAPIPIAKGTFPRWSVDGRYLFYLGGGDQGGERQFMQVPVETGGTFDPGIPRALFNARIQRSRVGFFGSQYDVAPDGRFVIIKPLVNKLFSGERPVPPISIVLNFFEQLKRIK